MNHSKQQGFTLIELMLAMTFLAMLILAIAMTTMQIGRIYSKGITLREVNQVGRTAIDDLRRAVGASKPFDLASSDVLITQPNGGRLCLGDYSYVWNTGDALKTGAGVYTYNDSASTPVHFARVKDNGRTICAAGFSRVNVNQATELLTSGDRDLVLQSLSIKRTANDTTVGQGQALYAVSMIIGTNSGDEDLLAGAAACKPPLEAIDAQEYCSINQFDIVVRAGNS